jgi:hypothetical protein
MNRKAMALKVARAWLRRAAVVPDDLFDRYSHQLKGILSGPTSGPRSVAQMIRKGIEPLFHQFVHDLRETGLTRNLLAHVVRNLNADLKILKEIETNLENLHIAMTCPQGDDKYLPEHEIKCRLASVLKDWFDNSVKTIDQALLENWSVRSIGATGLVDQILKQASPKELSMLGAVANGDESTEVLQQLRAFNVRAVDPLAKKLVIKNWLGDDNWWLGLFDQVKRNLTHESATDRPDEQFDLHGMKVVVDDDTVNAADIRAYVKYFDIAYQSLKSRRLHSAWYGDILIDCKGCGGVIDTGANIGGHFNVGKDQVTIFARPGPTISYIVVHELGHRYWFKSLSRGQRGKFESLVKVKGDGAKPVLPVSDYGASNIDEAFAEAFAWYVLRRKMNADQEASFKAVLLDKDRRSVTSKTASRSTSAARRVRRPRSS